MKNYFGACLLVLLALIAVGCAAVNRGNDSEIDISSSFEADMSVYEDDDFNIYEFSFGEASDDEIELIRAMIVDCYNVAMGDDLQDNNHFRASFNECIDVFFYSQSNESGMETETNANKSI